jgi:hypothetical protein
MTALQQFLTHTFFVIKAMVIFYLIRAFIYFGVFFGICAVAFYYLFKNRKQKIVTITPLPPITEEQIQKISGNCTLWVTDAKNNVIKTIKLSRELNPESSFADTAETFKQNIPLQIVQSSNSNTLQSIANQLAQYGVHYIIRNENGIIIIDSKQ